MAEYKGIKGFKVESLSSDPSILGQTWYNTTTSALKYNGLVGAWTTSNPANQPRGDAGSNTSGGTQTSFLGFGGYYNPVGNMSNSEEYDGTSWTATPALPAARAGIRGLGTSTATVAVDGDNSGYKNDCYEWNGSGWTAGGSTTTYRRGAMCAGIETAGLVTLGSGKYPSSTPGQGQRTEEYDGSTWTAGGDQLSSYGGSAGTGTQTAAINAGGAPNLGTTQYYDGTSWSEKADLNTARESLAVFGVQTSSIAASGQGPAIPGMTEACEEWDGSSWTTIPSYSSARYGAVAAGTTTAGVFGFGYIPPAPYFNTATEEWNKSITAKTVTVS
jgi:hypothetical protein